MTSLPAVPCAVFFDTNSYRGFVTGKTPTQVVQDTNNLRVKEAAKDIKQFGVMIVAIEMLANLAAGSSSFGYNDCLNGVIAMARHCWDDANSEPRMVPPPYLHIAHSFFSSRIPSEEQKVLEVGGVLRDFVYDPIGAETHHATASTYANVKTYVDGEEASFSSLLTSLISGLEAHVKATNPKADAKTRRNILLQFIDKGSFEPMIAETLITEIAQRLKLALPQPEITSRAAALNQEFPVASGFFKWVCYQIVANNINMNSKKSVKSRWNWLWDYQVSFMLSNHTIDNRHVLLVTSDGDMTKMLNDLGFGHNVLTLEQYLNLL